VSGWLLDTNVISEIRRPRPDPKVVAAIESWPLEHLFISVVTLAEIRFGIEQVDDFKRRTELNDWLSNKVRPMFEQRVLPISEDIMVKWRLLVEDGVADRRNGAGDDRHNGASFFGAKRTSRWG